MARSGRSRWPDFLDLVSTKPGSIQYYKAALQASNDKINIIRRGVIVGGVLEKIPKEDIEKSNHTRLNLIKGA
jgi:hypothetical protein